MDSGNDIRSLVDIVEGHSAYDGRGEEVMEQCLWLGSFHYRWIR